MITLDNFELYLIDYADGCLSPENEAELKAFLLLYPELEEKLEDLDQVKLTPVTIPFPHKDQLKQMVSAITDASSEEPRLLPDLTIHFEKKRNLYHKNTAILLLRRFSAAAILLLFLCMGGIHFYLNRTSSRPLMTSTLPDIRKETPLLPQEHKFLLKITHSCFPVKLQLKRTPCIEKKQTLCLHISPKTIAVSIPVDSVALTLKTSCSTEIFLTEEAKQWKPSEENFQSSNIVTSFIHAGKKLTDRRRKEEYALR